MEFDRKWAAVALIALILGFFGGVKYAAWKTISSAKTMEINQPAAVLQAEADKSQPREIKVYVTGAVCKPGVYALKEGDRLYQAVEMAGGLSEQAEVTSVNMAAVLKDGQSAVIPKQGEQVQTKTLKNQEAEAPPGGKVNINQATAQELENLEGVGPVLARRIVEYREEHGPFKQLEDLKKVNGIGEKKFAAFKERVCL